MTRVLAFILFLLLPVSAMPQECDCPFDNETTPPTQPNKIFSFTNKKTIALCGAYNIKNNDTLYHGFTLRLCDKNELIYGDANDETIPSIIKKINDTLFVKDLAGLSIGKNLTTVWVPFYVHKFFFNNKSIKEVTYYRKDLKKYSATQIKQVLNKYRQLQKPIKNYDTLLSISNMLFWGYVSGSKQCEVYLNTIEKKFGPFDGAISEDWNNIFATYEHWKKLNQK